MYRIGSRMLTGDSEVQRDFTGCRALLSNTIPTLNGLELNPGLRNESPAINHLSHCTAPSVCYKQYVKKFYPY